MAAKYSIVQFPTTGSGPKAPPGYQIVDVGALLASQQQLNRTAVPAAEKQLTVAALDSIVPIIYGRMKTAALLGNAVEWNNYWHFLCIWCLGEVDGFEQITVNDVAIALPALSSLHLGADVQAVDPSLAMALTVWWQAKGHPGEFYSETLPGICYNDVAIAVGDLDQPPQINAIIRGRKLYDPRDGAQDPDDKTTWVYSRNPALVLADFLRSTRYGPGYGMDWDSVIETADANDDTGRTADFVIDRRARVSDWVATLQTAANCWIAASGNIMKLKPDALTASVATFAHDTGDILKVDNEEGESAGNQITVMEIIYTDTSTVEWGDKSIPLIKLPGVDDFEIPYRKSSVRMPWVQDEAIGVREGYLRFNKLRLRQPKFAIDVMDEGLALEVGDRISLTYPDSGYSTLLPVKISSIAPTDQGYRLGVFYDDPGAYVDDRIADPTPPTDQPNPFLVPPVSNLSPTQVLGEPQIYTTWTPPDYPFIKDFHVQIYDDTDTLVSEGWPKKGFNFFQSGDLTPDADYTICVTVRNTLGILSVVVCAVFHLGTDFYISASSCFFNPTLVNMREMYNFATGTKYWVTTMGDIWNPTFPNDLDTYTDPLYQYHTPGTSTLTTEISDTGSQQVNAEFQGSTTSVAINGAVTKYQELSAIPASFVRQTPNYIGDGRYIRFSSESLLTATQRVNALGCYVVQRATDGGSPVPPPDVSWNPSDSGSNITLSNSNLTFQALSGTVGSGEWSRATVSRSTGKYYFEVHVDVNGNTTQAPQVGVQLGTVVNGHSKVGVIGGYTIQTSSGFTWENGVPTATGVNYGLGDVIGVAVDMTAGKIWFAINNTWIAAGNPGAGINERYSGLSGAMFPCISDANNAPVGTFTGRFKLAHFSYTPPAGFLSWQGT